uniref:Transcription elongation factor A N-terminal and central domain containing n=1 Tax=Tetraodon nigroviridis TaxID=99883 RepID=H3BW52_TETNG
AAMDVVHSVLEIERASRERNYRNILALLGDLDKAAITAEQLEMTDVVKVLYRLLKTCPEVGVRRAAKALLSRWKKEHSQDGDKQENNPELPCRSADVGAEKVHEDASTSGDKCGLRAASGASGGFSSVRSKCVQLLLSSLRPEPPEQAQAAELAAAIERHIHERHRSNPLKYKACVRSKVANLRNPQNQHLREGLLSASLSPLTFAGMSAEEMAGAALRRLREEYSSRGLSERQLPQAAEGTPTRKIRCKRCGGRECRVSQVARGALFLPAWVRRGIPGEDAMTFVTCSGCGEQWYHS